MNRRERMMLGRPAPPMVRCARCSRAASYAGPLDPYGACPTCSRAIREQVAASVPAIDRDCDALGAFHVWCREHDEAA